MHLGDHVLAVYDDGCVFRSAERHVQDRPIFRNIDFVASKHGFDPASQAALFGQLKQKFERFVGHTILRVIEVEAQGLRGQALAAFGVIRKELSKMKFSDLLMVRLKSLPTGAPGY
jgi:hypothetical protein